MIETMTPATFTTIISVVLLAAVHAVPVNEVADDFLTRYRLSFENRTWLITTILDEPFMRLKQSRNDNQQNEKAARGMILDPSMVEGYCADLAYAICHEKLKIPYKFLIETKYGGELKSGVWDGMIGVLVNRDADLAIASLTINAARQKVVDFSQPFINFALSIMIRKPKTQKPDAFFFMNPMSKEVWICIIVSYVLVRILSRFVDRVSSNVWYFESENENGVVPRHNFSCNNFTYQGVPSSIAGRIIISVWWFFCIILASLYIANLITFTVAEEMVTPIKTFEDLAKQTEIRYGLLKDSSTMAFFKKSTSPTIKTMWDFMQQRRDDAFISSTQEGIEKVRRSKGRFAFLLESTINEYVNQRIPCDTMRVGENVHTRSYGIATPHGSSLRQAIDIAVTELIETGFLEQLKQKWYYERSECGNGETKQRKSLNLVNVAGIFYILIVGLGLAMLIALLEFLRKAKLESTRLNQDMCNVIRRNLRILITGIGYEKKQEAVNYWRLQQQEQQNSAEPLQHRRAMKQNAQPSTTATAMESLKNNDEMVTESPRA